MPSHPIFAKIYGCCCRFCDFQLFGKERTALVAKCRGETLEIGCGSGANFSYYPKDISLTAIEPDPHMLKQAKKHLEKTRRASKTNLIEVGAENLPFNDDFFDTVIATLVFCTIPKPAQAMAEIIRVLRPGSSFLFLEHVIAKEGLTRDCQKLLNPLWKKLAGGCHLNRDTIGLLKQQPFSSLNFIQDRTLALGLLPIVHGSAEYKN